MADAVYTILKPSISNKQYKYIRSHNTYQNQWNDITKFVDSLLSTAETVYAKNLEKNIISSITLKLRNKLMKTFIVTYLSPGTLFSEMNTKEFSCGDLELLLPTIKDYAQKITQRHGAKPYGFTIEGIEGTYYIKGTIKTFHRVVQENFGKPDTILIRNMRNNNCTHIITGDSPYKFSMPFDPLKDKLI